MKHKYNYKRDKLDHRDYMLDTHASYLPPSADLTPECPPIRNQGHEGCCTGFAATSLWDFQQLKKSVSVTSSPQFTYYNERVNEGTIDEDSGASLRDIISSMCNVGVSSEELWPYISDMYARPCSEAYTYAAQNKVKVYCKLIQAPQFLKTQLAQGDPFIFGFSVFQSFEDESVARTGIMPMPGSKENLLGGHEVMCVGYDDEKQMYKIRNSWGVDWGLDGYFYMPYAYMHNPNLASDMWTFV